MVKAAENINRGKKLGNIALLKLLERLDLDRPLIFREKLEIIFNDKKSEPINIQNISQSQVQQDVSNNETNVVVNLTNELIEHKKSRSKVNNQ